MVKNCMLQTLSIKSTRVLQGWRTERPEKVRIKLGEKGKAF